MTRKNTLKLVHFISTAWFVLNAIYILIFSLLQSGRSWWVTVSLSGYSVIIMLLLISLYLFAVFRGVARSQKTKIEHPLTTSAYYSFFYDVSPFLGALAGSLGAIGVSRITDYFLVVAAASLWMTFLVWIIVDPVAGLLEMLLPSSRKHRRTRLARAEAMREKEHLSKERLLAEVEAKEKLHRDRWNNILLPYAEKLASLLVSHQVADECADRIEAEVIDIGVRAWQIGGLNCMQQLHSMAIEVCRQRYQNVKVIDYISIWWDGIGSWQSPWFEGEGELVLEWKRVLCGT